MFSVEKPDATLDFRVWNHNLITKNELIGTVSINLKDYPLKAWTESWLTLNTTGSIKIAISFDVLEVPMPFYSTLNERLPLMRVELNAREYFPGSVIRGAVIIGGNTRKETGMFLTFSGRSQIHWATNQGKFGHNSMVTFFHTQVQLKRSEDGCSRWLFEYQLPMDIPPSWNDSSQYVGNSNRYTVDVRSIMGTLLASTVQYRVLPLPTTMPGNVFPLPSLNPHGPWVDPYPEVTVDVKGPQSLHAGQQCTFDVAVKNASKSIVIDDLKLTLEVHYWFRHLPPNNTLLPSNTPAIQNWQTRADNRIVFTADAKYMIQAAQDWTGQLTVTLPSILLPSLFATTSPILQCAYYVCLSTMSKNALVKKGSLPVWIGSDPALTTRIPFSATSLGEPRTVLMSPIPQGSELLAVPALSQSANSVSIVPLSPYPALAGLPTAFKPPVRHLRFASFDKVEWTPGTMPTFIGDKLAAASNPHGGGPVLYFGGGVSSFGGYLQQIDFTPKVLADHMHYGFDPEYGYMEGNWPFNSEEPS